MVVSSSTQSGQEKLARGAADGRAGGVAIIEFCCDERAVVEHDQVLAGALGVRVAKRRREFGDGLPKPFAVVFDGYVNRMFWIGVFGGGVDELAAAEASGAGASVDQVEQGLERVFSTAAAEGSVDVVPEAVVSGPEVRFDQGFLGWEVAVER